MTCSDTYKYLSWEDVEREVLATDGCTTLCNFHDMLMYVANPAGRVLAFYMEDDGTIREHLFEADTSQALIHAYNRHACKGHKIGGS